MEMDIASLVRWAGIKGISLVGTGDFTHPEWLKELKRDLKPAGGGLYENGGVNFILTAEVSNIFKQGGRTRKIHTIIFAPDIKAAEEANKALSQYGSLASDGRPILKLACSEMVRMLSSVNDEIMCIPAHAWTPHFGLYGSASGFDSAEECFGDQIDKIYAIETGLSSDPPMNWICPDADRFCLISNSDAHSPSKLGREANVFSGKVEYRGLADILKKKDKKKFLYTIEYYPEEGKYHWDGHRKCGFSVDPSISKGGDCRCPACGKKLTIGVLHRVEELAARDVGYVDRSRPSYKRVVPLAEIISGALNVGAGSKKVAKEYFGIIDKLGSELDVLLEREEKELRMKCPKDVADGIMNARNGNVKIEPGYDGEYGKVKVL